ncbi:MAG: hypothetical protein U1E65_00995 [Myxococcota bacterium]
MPTVETILDQLAAAANGAWGVAIAWHILVAASLVALWVWGPPPRRIAAVALAAPIASASLVAFAFKNPFNGTLLGGLAVALTILGARLPLGRATPGPAWARIGGLAMIAFGVFYPHFLGDESPLAYLYAAPTGVIPCPTLATVIGFALLGQGLDTRGWPLTLAGAGLFYGLFGVLRLGVWLDIPLLVGTAALISIVWMRRPSSSAGPARGQLAPRLGL